MNVCLVHHLILMVLKKITHVNIYPPSKKCGLDYVKSVLNRNNASQQEDKSINYINPYDEMIKNDEKMIKEYVNQYEYDIDYEFDVNTVHDIKNERIEDEVLALYKSIDEYTEQKDIMDAKFEQYNK